MTMSYYPTIAFIGAGNMARCIINGLIANHYPASKIWASNPGTDELQFLAKQCHIHVTQDNKTAAKQAEIIVFAVKPTTMQNVMTELQEIIATQHPLVMSIAAGVTTAAMQQILSDNTAIVRCMPNLPAFVGSGATGMYANQAVSDLKRDLAESIMRAIGITVWVNDEKLIDVISALSGSGPAYFFLVIEALEAAAVQLGLSREDAHLLTLQTALGAARLALSTDEPIDRLRARVTSKGGITEQALAVLDKANTREAFTKALQAAHKACKSE